MMETLTDVTSIDDQRAINNAIHSSVDYEVLWPIFQTLTVGAEDADVEILEGASSGQCKIFRRGAGGLIYRLTFRLNLDKPGVGVSGEISIENTI